ncbi:hypothetical protein MMC26_004862 [Xylographa opegraphella]|nr:hypothetical protein [Xylographa opegraphella]
MINDQSPPSTDAHESMMDDDASAPRNSYAKIEYAKGDHVYFRDGGQSNTPCPPLNKEAVSNEIDGSGVWHQGIVEGVAESGEGTLYIITIANKFKTTTKSKDFIRLKRDEQ